MYEEELSMVPESDGPIAPSFSIFLRIMYVMICRRVSQVHSHSELCLFCRVQVKLCNRYPFSPLRLWRLVPVEVKTQIIGEGDPLEFVTSAPRNLKPEPSLKTAADTVIDVEGLKLGGNGEMSITTTTTTVTTSITTVKRLGVQ